MKFIVEVTLDDEKAAEVTPAPLDAHYPPEFFGAPNAHALADELHEYLCDGGDGTVPYPEWIYTADDCEPAR